MASGIERTRSQAESETSSLIKKEQELLFGDLSFFARHNNFGSVGVLTTSDLRFVSQTYPALAKELLGVYGQMTTPAVTESSQENYVDQYLAASLMQGELVSNEQARQLLEGVKQGEHSLQVIAYAKRLRELNKKQQQPKTRNYFGFDDEDEDSDSIEHQIKSEQEGSISYRKGQILSLIFDLENAIGALYGEVDYKRALLTEMLLQAPFLRSVTSVDVDTIDDQA